MIFQLSAEELAFLLPALLMSLTIHEYAHARVALYFGDYTAKSQGRVTLNPLKHLDIFGTIALLVAGFGWAKPVPVDKSQLRNPRFADIMISFAGPASNMLLALVSAIALRVLFAFSEPGEWVSAKTVLVCLASINTVLAVLNLLPLYPLDGHHIVRELLPYRQQIDFMDWQRKYGMIILAIIIFGPELLGRFNGQEAFDPLGWLIDKAEHLIFMIAA